MTTLQEFEPPPSVKATSADYLDATVRVMDGYGNLGAKPRPFNQLAAVRQFAGWVYKATTLNANAVARIPLRQYVKREPGMMLGDFHQRAAEDVLARKGVKRKSAGWWSGLGEYEAEISRRADAMFAEAQLAGRACRWRTKAVGHGVACYLTGDSRTAGRVGWSGSLPSKSVQLKVAEWDAQVEEVTERTPLLDTLSRGNPWLNGFGLTQLRIIYLLLTGNSYTFKMRDGALGIPVELWPMPSQWTRVRPSRETFIDGFVYGVGAENERFFAAQDVIHSKLPNPDDPYYGRGKVQAAWTALGLHSSKRTMDQAKFDNMNRPDWFIAFKQAVNPDALTRFEAKIDEKFRGASKSGKFLAIGSEATIQALNQQLDEIGDADRVVEEIAAAFDTPVSMLKANDPSRASAQTADTAWLRDAVRPLAIADEEDLNAQYVTAFRGSADTFLAYDPVSFEDETTIVRNAAAKLAAGITTVDEAREETGYKPLGGAAGEMRFFPSGATGSLAGLLGDLAPGQMQERTNENGVPPGTGLPESAAGDAGSTGGDPAPATNAEGTMGLNGAQITAAVDVFNKLRAGTLWREAAIESLVAVGIPRDRVMSAVGAMPQDDPDAKQSQQDQEFMRQVWLAFLNDGTINDVLANMTDLRKLRDAVRVPADPKYVDPFLPVQDAQGRTVTGSLVKDSQGDPIGAAVEPVPSAPSGGGTGVDLSQD